MITQLLSAMLLSSLTVAVVHKDGYFFNYCNVLPSSDKNLVSYWKYTKEGASGATLTNAFRGTYKALMIGQACSMDSVTRNDGIDPGCLANKLTSGSTEFWATCVKHPKLPSPPTCQFGGNPRGFLFRDSKAWQFQFPHLGRWYVMHDVRDVSMMTCGLRTMPHFRKLKPNTCAKNVCQFWM